MYQYVSSCRSVKGGTDKLRLSVCYVPYPRWHLKQARTNGETHYYASLRLSMLCLTCHFVIARVLSEAISCIVEKRLLREKTPRNDKYSGASYGKLS